MDVNKAESAEEENEIATGAEDCNGKIETDIQEENPNLFIGDCEITDDLVMDSSPEREICNSSSIDTLLLPNPEQAEQELSQNEQKSNKYVFIATAMAALGGILFGYDVGIISGALLQLKDEFHLSCLKSEWVVSSMLLGALVASACGGVLVDFCGRRISIIINSVIFTAGAVCLAFSQNYPVLLIGRLLVGFGISLSALAECVYISEIAPARKRGLLVSLNELGITVGFLLAYLVGYIFIGKDDGWRYMFGLSAIPAAVQGVGMFFLPSSPRYLMIKKKEQKAKSTLQLLRGCENVDKELSQIKSSITSEESHSILQLFSAKDNMRSRMCIGIGMVFLQQVTGQPNVLYYAPAVFQMVGFKGDSAAMLATVGLGIVKVICTTITLLCVDKAGRRTFLLIGTILMAVSIFSLGGVASLWPGIDDADPCNDKEMIHNQTFLALHNHTNLYNEISYKNSTDIYSNAIPASSRWFSLLCLMVYVCGYAIGFGPITWLILSEIFPVSIKGRAISISTIFNYGSNLIVSSTFLQVLSVLGVSLTFTLYGCVCVIAVLFIFFIVPETRGKSLEQISAELRISSVTKRIKNNCHLCLRKIQRRQTLQNRINEYLYEEVSSQGELHNCLEDSGI